MDSVTVAARVLLVLATKVTLAAADRLAAQEVSAVAADQHVGEQVVIDLAARARQRFIPLEGGLGPHEHFTVDDRGNHIRNGYHEPIFLGIAVCGAVQILLVDLFAVPVSGVLAHVDLVPGQVSHVLAVTQDLANRTRIPAPRRLVTAPAVADGRLGPAQFQFSADLSERPAEVSDGMKDEADDADFLFGP